LPTVVALLEAHDPAAAKIDAGNHDQWHLDEATKCRLAYN
jgi:hypothetical protein